MNNIQPPWVKGVRKSSRQSLEEWLSASDILLKEVTSTKGAQETE